MSSGIGHWSPTDDDRGGGATDGRHGGGTADGRHGGGTADGRHGGAGVDRHGGVGAADRHGGVGLVGEEEPPGLRARERRRARRAVGILMAVALVLAGVAGARAYQHHRAESFPAPQHLSTDGNGIAVSSGPVPVDVYTDLNCLRCKQFEAATGATVDHLLAEHAIALVYHPIAILDQSSEPPGYSTTAAAAVACAADGGRFLDYLRALFVSQPIENAAGLSEDRLVTIGGQVGLIDPRFAHCVRHGTYRDWVTHITDVATARGVSGTPTVLVAGHTLRAPNGDSLARAVAAAGR